MSVTQKFFFETVNASFMGMVTTLQCYIYPEKIKDLLIQQGFYIINSTHAEHKIDQKIFALASRYHDKNLYQLNAYCQRDLSAICLAFADRANDIVLANVKEQLITQIMKILHLSGWIRFFTFLFLCVGITIYYRANIKNIRFYQSIIQRFQVDVQEIERRYQEDLARVDENILHIKSVTTYIALILLLAYSPYIWVYNKTEYDTVSLCIDGLIGAGSAWLFNKKFIFLAHDNNDIQTHDVNHFVGEYETFGPSR